ncbi:GyrI-like domain-containing protein [Microbacterium sediminicola]|uniref:GyrI-like domain-containing protein n=1 Tax=Microbacterium sediminicola TaxID=415210 RepID=A0ABP4TXR4_9MICO
MKYDLKKDRADLYAPGAREFVRVVVPPITYLAIDGHGDPNTAPEYVQAVSALYATGYAIKFAFRARTGDDFVVGPLEGLWSADDPASFAERRKDAWDWTMLIPLPPLVAEVDVRAGLKTAARKKPDLPIAAVTPLVIDEGDSLQIMHIGAYDAEGPTLARLHHEVMPSLGLTWNGRHHEIYLGDPRRVARERLRTVLRQPVRPRDESGTR